MKPATAASTFDSARDARMTSIPGTFSNSCFAVSRPRPRFAPVMSATGMMSVRLMMRGRSVSLHHAHAKNKPSNDGDGMEKS